MTAPSAHPSRPFQRVVKCVGPSNGTSSVTRPLPAWTDVRETARVFCLSGAQAPGKKVRRVRVRSLTMLFPTLLKWPKSSSEGVQKLSNKLNQSVDTKKDRYEFIIV